MKTWLAGEPLQKMQQPARWGLLMLLSVLLGALLMWAHVPAALMLGPMLAGILIETGGGHVRIPAAPYWFAQAVLGCLIARSITPQISSTVAAHWTLFGSVMLAVILASLVLGWLLCRLRVFPNTTAVWGLLPGAASVMMIMADAFGADGRLVAFMQFLRVVLVAMVAAIIARFWVPASAHVTQLVWFPPLQGSAFPETLLFIGACLVLARKFAIPAGAILVPLVLGAALKLTGGLNLELPQYLLAASFALIGWNTGLGFNRAILMHAARTLPQTVLAIALLMTFCGAVAWLLVKAAGVDPLTAYLATTPGGVDSAAIIAVAGKVDMQFVMSMQVTRLLIILFAGPFFARWFARRLTGEPAPKSGKT